MTKGSSGQLNSRSRRAACQRPVISLRVVAPVCGPANATFDGGDLSEISVAAVVPLSLANGPLERNQAAAACREFQSGVGSLATRGW